MPKPAIAKEKARIAAAHPDRPGEQCRAAPGAFAPVVDRNRCEGKHSCVDVCPYGVFEVKTIEPADFGALSFFGKVKSVAHRRQTAYTPNAGACQACGLCVVACPEDAIRLIPRGGKATVAEVIDPDFHSGFFQLVTGSNVKFSGCPIRSLLRG